MLYKGEYYMIYLLLFMLFILTFFLGAITKKRRIQKRYFTKSEYKTFQTKSLKQSEEAEKQEKLVAFELQSLQSFIAHLEEVIFEKKLANQQLSNELAAIDKENLFLTKKINNRLFILKKLRGNPRSYK